MNVSERLARINERMDQHGFSDRLGECYKYAGQKVVDSTTAALVHGSIHLVGDPIDHAWVAFPDGIWEPTTNTRWYDEAEFAEVFGAVERVRYSRDEFLAVLLSVCHWGPYDEGSQAGSTRWETRAVNDARKGLEK